MRWKWNRMPQKKECHVCHSFMVGTSHVELNFYTVEDTKFEGMQYKPALKIDVVCDECGAYFRQVIKTRCESFMGEDEK